MSERTQSETITDLSTSLHDAMAGPDCGRAFLDGLRMQTKANAWSAPTQRIEYASDLLMRNLVVAANNIGVDRTAKATGTVYDEVLAVASHLTKQREPQTDDEKTAAMEILQHGFNTNELQIAEETEPGERVQLVDALMFANQELLTGIERDAITARTDPTYYVNNLTAAVRQLERQ